MYSIQQSIQKAKEIMMNKSEMEKQRREIEYAKFIREREEKMTNQYRQTNESIRNFIQDPSSTKMQDLVKGKSIFIGAISDCDCKSMPPSFFAGLQAEYGKYFEIKQHDIEYDEGDYYSGFSLPDTCQIYFKLSNTS